MTRDLVYKSGCFFMAALWEWWHAMTEEERLLVLAYLEQPSVKDRSET